LSARKNESAAPKASLAMNVSDWKRVESSPEFKRLVVERRRVVVPSLVAFALVFGTFTALAAWGRNFMAREFVNGFSVAYAFALGLIVMTWLLAFIYIRVSNRRIDPLAEAVQRLVAADEPSSGSDSHRLEATGPDGAPSR